MLGLVTLVAVVVAIIGGLKIGLSLGLSIALTTIGLGLLMGNLQKALVATLLNEDAWILILSALTIATLAELYRITNAVEELGQGLSSTLRDPRLGLATIPAVVGLMPVAGGALLSAPVVESLGAPIGLTAEALAYINVWFRHVLIYSYPFSQLIVVLSQLTGVPILTLMTATLPMTILMAAIGTATLLKAKVEPLEQVSRRSREDLKALVPLGVAIALLVPLVPLIGNWAIPLGTSVAVLVLVQLRKALKLLPHALISERVGDIILAVVAVIVLREVISLSNISMELQEAVSGFIRVELALAILSTLVSIATGSVMTGLFVSLPILSSLGIDSVGSILLIYTYSFLGYVASPTHLCLLYTVKYFKANLLGTYRYLLPSVLLALVVSTVYYLVI
ncbi:MAG: DUF401 family protein [Sulfolobales archaeon]